MDLGFERDLTRRIFYTPSRHGLWKAFLTFKAGTLFDRILGVVVCYSLLSVAVSAYFYYWAEKCDFTLYGVAAEHQAGGESAGLEAREVECLQKVQALMRVLAPVNEVYQSTTLLASFLLSMYVSQALARYFKYMHEARALQFALYDFCFSIRPHTDVSHADAHDFLTTIQRYLCLSHIYVWARVAPYQVVWEGFAAKDLLRHLTTTDFQDLRVLTEREAAILQRFDADKVHLVLMAWVSEMVKEAKDAKILQLEAPNYAQVQNNLNIVSTAAMRILATADTLIPHVYAQMMQVFVDVVCLMAAFSTTFIIVDALLGEYPVVWSMQSGWWCVLATVATAIQCVFYQVPSGPRTLG